MSKEELFGLITTKPNGNIEECNFKKKYQDFYNKINNIDYPVDFIWTQKLYHYFYNDFGLKLGICPICGKRCTFRSINLGYLHHCSKECKCKDKDVVEKMRQTNIKRYGEEFQGNRPEIIELMKETCQHKYNSDWASSSKEFREKVIQTNLSKFGHHYFTQTNEYKIKTFNTKKKNKTFNSSSIEQELLNWFIENNYNVLSQYKSDLYPYSCDFYLPDYNLYIEIQGTWTHGGHPFDENNPDDIEKLNIWKSRNTNYYKGAINNWTVRDVQKRNTAKENNLNYLEIFSYKFKEVLEIIKNELHKYKYKE